MEFALKGKAKSADIYNRVYRALGIRLLQDSNKDAPRRRKSKSMDINGVQPPSGPREVAGHRVPPSSRKSVRQTEDERDQLVISSEARAALEVIELTQKVQELPDIREEELARAEENLRQGNQDDPEVVREVAGRILDDLGA